MARHLFATIQRMANHVDFDLQIEAFDAQYGAAAAVLTPEQSNRLLVLLLEDEPLIAMDVELTLGGSNFDVVNIMSCQEAHGWLDFNVPVVVIVDVDLRDGRCTDVASRLIQANIPFIVHSGQQKRNFAGSPFASGDWVGKPSPADQLIEAVKAAARGIVRRIPENI